MRLDDILKEEEKGWWDSIKAIGSHMMGNNPDEELYKWIEKNLHRKGTSWIFRNVNTEFPKQHYTKSDVQHQINLVLKMRRGATESRINESEELPYNVVEDTIIFMRNDPDFYRKELFPALTTIADLFRSGKSISPNRCLEPVIEKGCDAYCSRFGNGRSPEQIYNNEHRKEILKTLYAEAIEEIRNGEYK